MNDRRRINGPIGGTAPPVYAKSIALNSDGDLNRPVRTRPPNVLRKMFLKTGVTPSASGSAYLELEALSNSPISTPQTLSSSGLKITCTVHGPRPLPRSAPFTPHIILTTHVKFAPFATRRRRGYLRDTSERDLAVHLETALRGVIIGNRWPKSGVEVIITILEGEEDQWWGNERTGTEPGNSGQWGFMSALSGCITVASAAIVDAGIDCVDVISGGIAALVATPKVSSDSKLCTLATSVVLDPVPSEHTNILAACVVGYLPSRDEITDLLLKGKLGGMNRHSESANSTYDDLVDGAVQAALGSHCVLTAALKEAAEMRNIS